MEQQLTLEFGSLVSSVHETRIDATELSNGENWLSRDGVCRLDIRYELFVEKETEDVAAYGIGYGKYVGEDAYTEQIAYVIGNPVTDTAQLLQYDLTSHDSGLQVICSDIAPVDWYFQQYQDYMYLVSTEGFLRYQMKDSPGSVCDGLARPDAPPTAPAINADSPLWERVNWAGSSITAAGSASTAYDSTLQAWTVNYAGAGLRTVQIDFATSPNRKPDWEYRDMIQHFLRKTSTVGMPIVYLKQGSNTIKILDWWDEVNGNGHRLYNRLHNIARDGRNSVASIIFEFTTPAGNSFIEIHAPYYARVWLTADTAANPGPREHPPFSDLLYAYTRYDPVTDFESSLSPVLKLTASQQNFFGDWMLMHGNSDALSGAPKWRYYRGVESGGVTTYYRLTTVDAAVTAVFTDKFPLDEIEELETYQSTELPTSGFTAITAWQERLWLASGSIVYGSRFNAPLDYESIEGPADPFDEGQGLTFYPDDRRSERVLALIGQDDLYIVTDFSVRCLVGNSPLNWRNIKLPDIEGACGARAACPYKKGVLVLTPSGRLLYHHSSLSEPELVGEEVKSRLGNAGLANLANADAVVRVFPDGQIEVRSGQLYYILDTDGRWRKGTYHNSAKDLLYISGHTRRWLGTDGRIYKAGGFTDNGVPVIFYVTTKKFRGESIQLNNVYFGSTLQVVNPSTGDVIYPRIELSFQGKEIRSFVPSAGRRNIPFGRLAPDLTGETMLVTLYGDKDTVIEECRLTLELLDEARHL